MKKLFLAITLAGCSLFALTACNNGAYDANPNTNNSGVTNPNSGGGTSGGNSSFNWTGTDPMSAKIDGVAFQATSADVVDIMGFSTITGRSSVSNEDFAITLFTTPTANTVYNFSTTNSGTYTKGASDMYTSNTASGGSGAIKILENDATHMKGSFYGTFKNAAGVSKTVTEGYFNIKK